MPLNTFSSITLATLLIGLSSAAHASTFTVAADAPTDAAVIDAIGAEIANSSLDLIGYTSICEEGPCGQFYHTTPTLKNQSGTEQLFTVDLVYESSDGERLWGPDPAQVMCSTDRPMVVREIDAEYIIFHIAPHQITSDEDMNLTSLYWSVCYGIQADLLSPNEMAQQAEALGYDLDRRFSVFYSAFFEPFEG
ncbi:MAG: hypothetical protein ACFB0C_06670 [Leptolyngbyaceae cyanobacterium]